MKLAFIGTGYVGLVSGACFADWGFDVTCVDMDAGKIARLEQGEIPIYEPGLPGVVKRTTERGHLHFTTDLDAGVSDADAVFIAVGTPTEKGSERADLRYVMTAAEQVANAAKDGVVLITKSTVPVGTAAKIRAHIDGLGLSKNIHVASNPEFLREGSAVMDFKEPDRVVVGYEGEAAGEVMRALYAPLDQQGVTILETDCATAELIKYAANAFLATKIGFINEMADIAENVGADITHVAKGMGLDARIGEAFLFPGPGFGGSCFPKDTRALKSIGLDAGAPSRIVASVIESNEARKEAMVAKILRAASGRVKGMRIAVLGLTFKANTDDMRESASLTIIPALLEHGAEIIAYDPEGMEEAKPLLPVGCGYANSVESALTDADMAVIITEWSEFRTMPKENFTSLMRSPLVVDLRNLYSPSSMKKMGVSYISVGRPDVSAAMDLLERVG